MSEQDHDYAIETLCLHAGQIPDAATGARAVPLYQSTSFVFDDAEHASRLFNLQTFGNVYSRLSNPTNSVFEERIAALEGGRAALAVSSGLAAQAVVLMTLCASGDHIVSASTIYGGSYTQMDVTLRRMGVQTTFVDPDNLDSFRQAIGPKTRLIYAETVGNPKVNVLDIQALAEIAHAAGIPLVVDNTVPTPYLCRPIEFGADIVIHSATKFIGGHGTSLGGVIVESGKFPWDNGKFPEMTDPSEGYHGVRFYETFGDFAFTMKCRYETLRTLGPSLSPFNAWSLLQGLETLHVRMDRHCENAQRVAEYLQQHPQVKDVAYPGLADSPYAAQCRKYLPRGASALLTFGLNGGREQGERFIQRCTFFSHLANIGDAKTLMIHPASTTHRQLNEAQLSAAGVSADMIRLCVGIENIDDILTELDYALN